MRILVTGANGYLGQGIVKQLLDFNIEVIATDFVLDNVDNRAIKKECDIFSIKNPFTYFDRPDAMLHLAWKNGFVHNSDTHIEEFPLHYLFIKKMIEDGLKQISVLGTMHEIGFYEGCINENTPCNPLSLYGIAKDALRKSVFLLCKDNDVVCHWIRAFYIVGNTEYGSSIFSKITKAEHEHRDTFPFTSGNNQWDFVDYSDFCDQIVHIVTQTKIIGIINACSGFPQKLSEKVEDFIKINNYSIKLQYGAYPDRPYDSKAVWGDNKKIVYIMEKEE